VTDPTATARIPARSFLASFVVAAVAATLFFAPFLFGGALHGYDWGSHHYNYFDWVRVSLVQYHTLPLFMNDAWITKNFLANAEAPSLGPLVGLLWFLPTGAYIKLLLVTFAAIGLVGSYWLLRDLGAAVPIAAFVACTFAFSGFNVAHIGVGHHWAMGAQLLPGLVCLFRRAAFGSAGALWALAAANAFTIGGGQHQPFIWQNLVLAMFAVLWAVQRRAWFPLWKWALAVLLTFALGAVKLLPMIAEFAAYDPSQRTPALPLALLWTTLAGTNQHPELAPPGLVLSHGGGWWEYAFFVGPLALAALLLGLLAARRCWPLVAIGAFFLALAVEWPSPIAAFELWPRLLDLPLWRTQRSPSRFLFLSFFTLTVVGGVGLQRLWELARPRAPRAVLASVIAWTALATAHLFVESLPWQGAAHGEAPPAQDHRPRPLVLGSPRTASVGLHRFEPNRLVYRAVAVQETRIVFPFRLGEGTDEWRVEGLPAYREGGKLALDVPPGERDIAMIYRPKLFHPGAVISSATAFGLIGLALLRRRRATRVPPT
jgi:hypothetical protein